MHDEAISYAPGNAGVPLSDLSALGDDLRQGGRLTSEVLEELDVRPGDGAGDRSHHRLVMTRECVSGSVLAPRLELHSKGIAEELADPSVLRDGR